MESPPADLPQYDRDLIFESLDLNFNRTILESLLQGLYTVIVAITLWTALSSPKRSGNVFLLTAIITLYVLTAVAFGFGWAYQRRAFIQNGDNFYTVFVALQAVGPLWKAYELVSAINGGISTIIVDITLIWRCWVLWGCRWLIVLIPGLCVIAETIMRSLQICSAFINMTSDIGNTRGFATDINWPLICASLTLATIPLCTFLIVYRIVRLASGLSSCGKTVATVIGSSAMYSLTLIVDLALMTMNLESSFYANIITAYVKVIAPTVLIGCVAAGSNSNPSSQAIVNSTRDRSSVLSRFKVRKRENVVVCRDVEDSTTPLGSYGMS